MTYPNGSFDTPPPPAWPPPRPPRRGLGKRSKIALIVAGGLVGISVIAGVAGAAKGSSSPAVSSRTSTGSSSSSDYVSPEQGQNAGTVDTAPAPTPTAAPTPVPTPTPTAAPCPPGYHNGTPGDSYSGCFPDPTPTPVPVPRYIFSRTSDCILSVTDTQTSDLLWAGVTDNNAIGSSDVSQAAQDYCTNVEDAANSVPDTMGGPSYDDQTHGAPICHYAIFYEGTTLSVTAYEQSDSNPGWALAFCNEKLGANTGT